MCKVYIKFVAVFVVLLGSFMGFAVQSLSDVVAQNESDDTSDENPKKGFSGPSLFGGKTVEQMKAETDAKAEAKAKAEAEMKARVEAELKAKQPKAQTSTDEATGEEEITGEETSDTETAVPAKPAKPTKIDHKASAGSSPTNTESKPGQTQGQDKGKASKAAKPEEQDYLRGY